ncbi:SDR family oxidoreductase [Paraburkholderia sp. Ac-20342]|uniref:SDR family NAD(P)-dependent oxidoreductase n=1 Tax=Paraburkholderia sp. Ac-20342 TaxID=2703889 RepID=UPI00197D0639|nr:SDR family oxidoreductase [Paraburkholderia sp. Ac-20342]MBN3849329.1 SDR family oxidoreductase [Paraburkholderia sp. Ac-20342]
MKNPYEGMKAIVTGGGAGIGQAIAQAFIERGMHVGVLDLSIEGVPEGAQGFVVDVRNDQQVNAAIERFADAAGGIDVLVNNAGISYQGRVEDGEIADWLPVFDINVVGYARCVRAALPYLKHSKSASIVNIASCTAATGLRRRVVYSATKGAIVSMTQAMAADLLHEGVRVNCVNPGTVDTPFISTLVARAKDPAAQLLAYQNRQPTGFLVSPAEVAEAVVYLAHPAAKSTSGTTLTVDGGMKNLLLFDL